MNPFSIKKKDISSDTWLVNFWPDKNVLEIQVPFPKEYPPTLLHSRAATTTCNKTSCLAELLCSFEKKTKNSPGKVFLHAFYVYTAPSLNIDDKTHQPLPVLDEERKLTKGLGKEMLCYALNLLLRENHIQPEATIFIEASGGNCDDSSVRSVMQHHSEADLDKFLKDYPDNVESLYETLGPEDDVYFEKAKLLCEYEANQRLVSYYKTFGLKEATREQVFGVKDDDTPQIYVTLLSGLVRHVIRQCSVSRSRSRSRTRSRSRSTSRRSASRSSTSRRSASRSSTSRL